MGRYIDSAELSPDSPALKQAYPRGASMTEPDKAIHVDSPKEDNWKHRSKGMLCQTCIWYVPKQRTDEAKRLDVGIGRCRRHSPTMSGWPVMWPSDGCGDHKLDEEKV